METKSWFRHLINLKWEGYQQSRRSRHIPSSSEFRAITNSQRMRISAVMISSTVPSPKYSCSGSHAGCHLPVLGRITAPPRRPGKRDVAEPGRSQHRDREIKRIAIVTDRRVVPMLRFVNDRRRHKKEDEELGSRDNRIVIAPYDAIGAKRSARSARRKPSPCRLIGTRTLHRTHLFQQCIPPHLDTSRISGERETHDVAGKRPRRSPAIGLK
jgi:hypothetical protein